MKPILFALSFFLIFLIISCNRIWVRHETIENEIIWKKERYKRNKKIKGENIPVDQTLCFKNFNKVIKKDSVQDKIYFEYDSIRIFIEKKDFILLKLFQDGMVSGQMFFSPKKPDNCHFMIWQNPTKSEYLKWKGYNIFLSNLREIKTTKFPKRLQAKINSYKVFDFSYYFKGQPFIGPEIFRIEIENKNYKSNFKNINFDTFMKNAIVKNFRHHGFEI